MNTTDDWNDDADLGQDELTADAPDWTRMAPAVFTSPDPLAWDIETELPGRTADYLLERWGIVWPGSWEAVEPADLPVVMAAARMGMAYALKDAIGLMEGEQARLAVKLGELKLRAWTLEGEATAGLEALDEKRKRDSCPEIPED